MAEEKESNLSKLKVADSLTDDGAPPPYILEHSRDADEAMKAFEGEETDNLELDEETSKKLLRKIDLNIMPVRATSQIAWHLGLTISSCYVSFMDSIISTVGLTLEDKSNHSLTKSQRQRFPTPA